VKSKELVNKIFAMADVSLNGDRDWDMQVHDARTYSAILNQGSLGLGESYMSDWWDCQQLDVMIAKLLAAKVEGQIKTNIGLAWHMLKHRLFNQQTKSKAWKVGKVHYDIGNDLYSKMLDPSMSYSCGYWLKADNLDQAQQAKLELICQKLQLKPGMRLLDIGCGWGGMAQYAAQNYGVTVVGITISQEQQKLAQQRCQGLDIEIRLQDYRDLAEPFDRIVSIGMFEHVGYKNYPDFMRVVHRCLADEGLFLLHTIGSNSPGFTTEPWIEKYIFPNGMLPSVSQISDAFDGLFVLEDWHNFGADYDKTLMA
jgi:cyclopropane-fatty-acyl-phospholipid synthase